MKNDGVPETPLRSARVDVLRDARRSFVRAQVLAEPVDVEAELLRVAEQIGDAQRVLAVEQQIVHLPEPSLLRRRLDRLGRLLRPRMDVVQREVPPHVRDLAVPREQLAERTLGLAAVRALEVAVLDHRHGCVDRPADVVAIRVDRRTEIDDHLRRPEQCADPQPRRQHRGGAVDEPA